MCRVVRGPIELPLKAPASVATRGEALEAVLNDDGKPRVAAFLIAPPTTSASLAPALEPVAGGASPGYGVPCALAGESVFCADRSGAVHRARHDGSGDRVVGSSRKGSRIAAATLGGGHSALGYLASRQTSEGWVSEAWLVVDDEPPVRLSDEGAGATSLAFVPRGDGVLSLSVDARAALTGLHARSIAFEGGHVRLGEDTVVFVGGPGDRRTGAAVVAPSKGPAWGLLPIAKDVGTFGLALVRLDEPPRVDEPVVWSMYPNGLDPAPVAAVPAASATWAARVRPLDATPGAPRVLELGQIDPAGVFVPDDVVPTTGRPSDVALAADAHGALWLAWVDGAGSWLERLACSAAGLPARR